MPLQDTDPTPSFGGFGVRRSNFRQCVGNLRVVQGPLVGRPGSIPRQHSVNGSHRVIRTMPLNNRPLHDCRHPPAHLFSRRSLGRPDRPQDGQHVSRGDAVDTLAADAWEYVGFEARPPLLLNSATSPPALGKGSEDLLGGLGKRRYLDLRLAQVTTSSCYSCVLKGLFACFGQCYYRIGPQTYVDHLALHSEPLRERLGPANTSSWLYQER